MTSPRPLTDQMMLVFSSAIRGEHARVVELLSEMADHEVEYISHTMSNLWPKVLARRALIIVERVAKPRAEEITEEMFGGETVDTENKKE